MATKVRRDLLRRFLRTVHPDLLHRHSESVRLTNTRSMQLLNELMVDLGTITEKGLAIDAKLARLKPMELRFYFLRDTSGDCSDDDDNDDDDMKDDADEDNNDNSDELGCFTLVADPGRWVQEELRGRRGTSSKSFDGSGKRADDFIVDVLQELVRRVGTADAGVGTCGMDGQRQEAGTSDSTEEPRQTPRRESAAASRQMNVAAAAGGRAVSARQAARDEMKRWVSDEGFLLFHDLDVAEAQQRRDYGHEHDEGGSDRSVSTTTGGGLCDQGAVYEELGPKDIHLQTDPAFIAQLVGNLLRPWKVDGGGSDVNQQHQEQQHKQEEEEEAAEGAPGAVSASDVGQSTAALMFALMFHAEWETVYWLATVESPRTRVVWAARPGAAPPQAAPVCSALIHIPVGSEPSDIGKLLDEHRSRWKRD